MAQRHPAGAHILLRCIHALMPKDSRFIFVAAADELLVIGRHKFGCTILQKALESSMRDVPLQLVRCKALSFCRASARFLPKTVPFLAVCLPFR
eukprot:SAG22_NODE_1049_length_5844_cov_2.122520_5_plen_94_part_00